MDAATLSTVPIVDSDTHVTEPLDLWLSRLPSKWREIAPQVRFDEATSTNRWRVGDQWLAPVGNFSLAGYDKFGPQSPPTFEEIDPACWDPVLRLKRMDEYGIHAQVLYPNLVGFDAFAFMAQPDPEFSLACIAAYNDFLTDFVSTAPDRFIAICAVPFWDMEAALREIRRCADAGHKGVLFANKYENAGLPSFVDPYWDPVYQLCQDLELSVNYHVTFSTRVRNNDPATKVIYDTQARLMADPTDRVARKMFVEQSVPTLLGNAYTLTSLLLSDLCIRFPRVKFVSVESGFGYVPYLLEAIDWQWQQLGARELFTDRLMPSEYFMRQCYGTFWFERTTLSMLPDYPDNFMFETDFPHMTSMTPGPASCAELPRLHVQKAFADVPDDVARKALYGNAAKIYHLSL